MNKLIYALFLVAALANQHITTKEDDTLDLIGGKMRLQMSDSSSWVRLTWQKIVEVDALGRTVYSIDLTDHTFHWCGPMQMKLNSSDASAFQFSVQLPNDAIWNVTVFYDYSSNSSSNSSSSNSSSSSIHNNSSSSISSQTPSTSTSSSFRGSSSESSVGSSTSSSGSPRDAPVDSSGSSSSASGSSSGSSSSERSPIESSSTSLNSSSSSSNHSSSSSMNNSTNNSTNNSSSFLPHSIKFTIEVDDWPFQTWSNMLRFEALLESDNAYSDIDEPMEIEWGSGILNSAKEATLDGNNKSVLVSTFLLERATDDGTIFNMPCARNSQSSSSSTSNNSSGSGHQSSSDNGSNSSLPTRSNESSSVGTGSSSELNHSSSSATTNSSSSSSGPTGMSVEPNLLAKKQQLQRRGDDDDQSMSDFGYRIGVEWLFTNFNRTLFYDPFLGVTKANNND